ncbi:SH3 domain-containing kinase-binding protein 1 isoform X3 [Procambarus clarkii]|uniref:SH3 domain-containing kinase-binding protein 1 isoform X3 n=1 Tax=Procambarus clarkii TaxID=6728 RepID=UPI001E671DAA|nr:SH3 domain-containing kinase-binding protein 1-like isoform X3 [Procambarus clarkii]
MFLVCCSRRPKRYSFTPSYSFCHHRASVYQVLSKEPKTDSAETSATTPPHVQKRGVSLRAGRHSVDQSSQMGGRRCRVVFSYNPQHDDELTLCVGQTITILQEVEEGWWKGVLDGQVGMFPSNFVEDVAEEELTPKNTESDLENINNQLNINGDGKEIKPKPIQGMGYGVKLTDLKKEGTTKKESENSTSNGSAKILGSSGSSAFQPVHKTKEAPRENGQVKEFRDLPHRLPPALEPKTERVTSKTDKTRINAADKERINSLEKDRTNPIVEDKNKVEQNGRRELPISVASTIPPQLPPPQLPPKPVREIARVMFPYAAEHEDELELKEGDIITVLCKELEDKGWWRGELNGHIGVFPDNFVELMSVEETAKPPRPEKPAAVLAKKGSPNSSADSTPTGTLNKSDKEPPPPLPEKKVQPPPPPEKKPPVQSNSIPDAHDGSPTPRDHTEIGMPKFLKKSVPKESSDKSDESSLTLDTDGEKLKHVTHLRPKGPPRRRPPSGIFKDNMKNQNTADSDPQLPPTPEDEVDSDTAPQTNGHLGVTEPARSPSVSLASPTSSKATVELRSRPEPLPRPESTNSVPWLQELRQNQKQKKRLSGILLPEGEGAPAPAPVMSSKPAMLPQKLEDKPAAKPPKPSMGSSDAPAATTRSKPTEAPRLPTPDYDHKPLVSQFPTSKNKPLPATPLGVTSMENKRLITNTDTRISVTLSPENKKPSSTIDTKDNKMSTSDSGNYVEEKIDALYKELLPKIKALEDRLEDQRKEQARRMQSLMHELDEERKKRACMEVEMERLRKLVDAYAQV